MRVVSERPDVLRHPFWMAVNVRQHRLGDEYAALKRHPVNHPVYFLRLAQLALKSGDFDACQEYLDRFEAEHGPDSNLRSLSRAFQRHFKFHTNLTEADAQNIAVSEPHDLRDMWAVEAYFLDLYTASMYYLQNLAAIPAKSHLDRLKSLCREYDVPCQLELQELLDYLKIIQASSDLDAIENQLHSKVRMLLPNQLHNLILLSRIKGVRGDYEGTYALIRRFPNFLLPPHTKLLASLISHNLTPFNQKEVDARPELYWANVFLGMITYDPHKVLDTKVVLSDDYPLRVHNAARLARVWAMTELKRFDAAAQELQTLRIPAVEYDLSFVWHLSAMKLHLVTDFSLGCLKADFVQAVQTCVRLFKYLAPAKVALEKNTVPAFSECVWVLMCVDEAVQQYFQDSETVVLYKDRILVSNHLRTTPVYRALFTRETDGYNAESLRKAAQRINHKLIVSRRHMVLDFELIETFLGSVISRLPMHSGTLKREFEALRAKGNPIMEAEAG